MENIGSAINYVSPGDYMVSLDLKDAYFSVPIHRLDRKLLRFFWKGQRFEFTCLPFGYSLAPRVFFKILKPFAATWRSKGIRISIYIDDILIIASSAKQAATLLAIIRNSLESLGFLVNIKKSRVTPTRITYLGFEIDSEFCKSQALLAGRDYDDHSCLDINSRFDLLWIIQNIVTFNGKVFQEPEINLFVNSDATLTGWGASCNGQTTGGRWSLSESNNHINFLELLAAFLALQSFVSQSNIHVRLKLDNTTAVSYINNMGGIRSEPLNTLAKEIWHWCMSREIWLSAQYVPGDSNHLQPRSQGFFPKKMGRAGKGPGIGRSILFSYWLVAMLQ